MTNEWLHVREAAQLLGIHSKTLKRWADAGEIPAYRLAGRGDHRFRRTELEAWLLDRQSGVRTAPSDATRPDPLT